MSGESKRMENQTAPALEILLGLYQLQKDTTKKYTWLLRHIPEIEVDIKAIFGRIIEESDTASIELKTFLDKTNAIYTDAVVDRVSLNLPANPSDEKNLLEQCLKDLEALQNAYSIALSWKGTERIAGKFPFDHLQKIKLLNDHVRMIWEVR